MHKNKKTGTTTRNFWDILVQEVRSGTHHSAGIQPPEGAVMYETQYPRRSMKYTLGEPHTSIYFTQREAECVIQILQGKTMNETGETLKLSARTVEYYLGRIKKKLNCRKKRDIIRIVSQTDFIKNFKKDPHNQL